MASYQPSHPQGQVYQQDPNKAQQYQQSNYPQPYQQQPYSQPPPTIMVQQQYVNQQMNYLNAQDPSNPYPQQVPQDLMGVNQQHEAEQKYKTSEAVLNCIPALRGKTDRQNFVIKTYTLIFLMLGVTTLFTACMITDTFGDSQAFVLSNIGLYYFSLVVVIVIMIGMTCFYKKCRKVPMNYILLGTYTFFHSYLIGAMSVFYSRESVMIAATATMAMFIALTIYAIRTKTDMTMMGGALYSGTMMVVVLIIVLSIFNVSSIFSPILICILICLLSVWIVYDTQIIIGGNKYAELELDDYCIGALIIYSDVVTIFSYILQLCGN